LVNLVQVSLANNEEIVDLRPLANMQDLTFVAVQGIPSAHSPENCQVLNGLVDRGVEVDGFDPERCPEVVVGCTVTFPDQNLHNAVCEHLEMQDSCEISCDDPMFLSTTRINLSSLGIQDISGIERFGNLNELRLSYNQITNISPVSGLVNLTTLFMNGNQIDNISPIFGLVDLEMLVLTDNRVVDISSIANLTNLSYLGISDNQVVDISPLSHLVGLEHLSLATNYGILDFRPVGQIPNLLYFSVYNIQSAYTAENCQVLNGLVDRGVEVYGFDSEECLPEPVIIHTSLNPQHFNQQELFNGTNTLISFIISSLDEDLEILSIEVEVIQSLARVDQEIELWDDEQFMSFAHLRETQNESVFSSIFFTDDVQLLVSEVGSHLDIQGDVFGVVAGSAVVTCLRSITYRSLDYGEEQSIDFDREMCQTLSH